MSIKALGRLFDLVSGINPIDLGAGANTGNRVNLKHAGGVTIVLFKEVGAAGEDPVITLQEHNAATGGTSQNLAVIDTIYQKTKATALLGDETWTKVTQAKAATATLTGLGDDFGIFVIEVEASQLSDGFNWVSVNIADVGATGGQLGAVLYILRDLEIQRKPENLVNPQAA